MVWIDLEIFCLEEYNCLRLPGAEACAHEEPEDGWVREDSPESSEVVCHDITQFPLLELDHHFFARSEAFAWLRQSVKDPTWHPIEIK